ncbi:hypothetical protein [Fontivita pretiosa]|uniref:hypothetical protein n=1 Tax=Fontivita pretiosa TaxID=2989684 RepID=UPI003D181CDF
MESSRQAATVADLAAATHAAPPVHAPQPAAADAAGQRPPVASPHSLPQDRAGAWTIPLLCAGVAIIACCLLIPAADENRRLVYEREKLRLDLEQIHRQIAVNDEFLHRVADDPTLLERLAQRQMKLVREGTSVLELKGQADRRHDLSPFLLVTLPPPAELPPYKPIGGRFSQMCRQPRSRLLLMGAGMLLLAAGLVLGAAGRRAWADPLD